jgi:hypothetical protein
MKTTPEFEELGLGSDVYRVQDNGPINHFVLITGWDQEKEAWTIKNSWGAEWGHEGFALVGYGCSGLGTAATWVVAASIAHPPELSEIRKLVPDAQPFVRPNLDLDPNASLLEGRVENIVQLDTQIQVFGGGKPPVGVASIELQVGKRAYSWRYGENEPWRGGTVHPFSRAVDPPVPLDGTIRCVSRLNVQGELDWNVRFVTDVGRTLTFSGRFGYDRESASVPRILRPK